MLYVDQPFNFNEKVKPVKLDTNLDWPKMTEFSVSGWGSLQVSFFCKCENQPITV